jgi:hypothetical protein
MWTMWSMGCLSWWWVGSKRKLNRPISDEIPATKKEPNSAPPTDLSSRTQWGTWTGEMTRTLAYAVPSLRLGWQTRIGPWWHILSEVLNTLARFDPTHHQFRHPIDHIKSIDHIKPIISNNK